MTTTKKLDSKILGVHIIDKMQPTVVVSAQKLKRPQALPAVVYKLETPLSEYPLYITISDIEDSTGTRRPFEIFINTKSVDSLQWVTSFTRLLSSIFRIGGDITFVLEELQSVHDPKSGYTSRNGWIPSLVAEIGLIIKQHFLSIGLIEHEQLDEHTKKIIADKAASTTQRAICPKCNQQKLIVDGGCGMCESCGYSKCG